MTGCLDSNVFNNEKIVELNIRNQNVPILRTNAIYNFDSLRLINFNGSNIEKLQQGSFRFVPQLTDLKLSYNRLKFIPENVFNGLNIKRLHLNDNGLEEIQGNAFKSMKKLLEFYANNNNLQFYNTNWFKSSNELRVIDFSNNKLRNIPTRSFVANEKLRNLYLNSNELSIIQDDAFTGLKSLEYLSLSGNNLKHLYPQMFPRNFAIRRFNLDNNQLNFIPNDLLENLRVNDINVSGNPWKCSCLNNIKKWMSSRNGLIKSYCSGSPIPTCSYPEKDANYCTEHYDEDFTKSFYNRYVIGKALPAGC